MTRRPCPLPGCTLDGRHKGAHVVPDSDGELCTVMRLPTDPQPTRGRPRTREPVPRRERAGRPPLPAGEGRPVRVAFRVGVEVARALSELGPSRDLAARGIVERAVARKKK